MHDRLNHDPMNHAPQDNDAALAAALRALPAHAPTRDAWPDLAARVRRRRVARKTVWFTLPAAFAAGLALTLAWPHLHLRPVPLRPARVAMQSTTGHVATPAAPDVATLQASSRQWQAWVQALVRDGAPLDGQQLAQAVSLQDRIGLVDLQLSAAHNGATTADLWRQRITLLQQLGLLHLQPYLAASQGSASNDHVISM